MMSIGRNNIGWAVLLLGCVAVVMGLFSYFTVWLGDDINYAYSCTDIVNKERIRNIEDIFVSQYAHYFNTNGRYVAHVFVQLFCGILGHLWFAIANGLFYVLFFVVLAKLCLVELRNFRGFVAIVLLGLITFQTKMTPSCQIGYIWTFTATMLFLSLFFKKDCHTGWWSLTVIAALSLLAGNGQEALNLGVGGALVIHWMKNMRKMTRMQYVMMIAFGIGLSICCLSPGTRSRASDTFSVTYRLIPIMQNIPNFFINVRSFYFLAIVFLWRRYKSHYSLRQIYDSSPFFWNVWVIMLCFNLIIGIRDNRPLFGMELSSIIIGMRLLKPVRIKSVWIYLMGILLILTYCLQGEYCIRIHDYYENIKQQYAESNDGHVYIDMDMSNYIPGTNVFVETIPQYGIKMGDGYADTEFTYADFLFRYHLRDGFQGKPNVVIIPEILRGKEKSNMENQVLELYPHCYLVIQDLRNPKDLYVERSISMLGYHKCYEPMRIDMDECLLCEGEQWKARLINEQYYTVLGLSDNRFIQK